MFILISWGKLQKNMFPESILNVKKYKFCTGRKAKLSAFISYFGRQNRIKFTHSLPNESEEHLNSSYDAKFSHLPHNSLYSPQLPISPTTPHLPHNSPSSSDAAARGTPRRSLSWGNACPSWWRTGCPGRPWSAARSRPRASCRPTALCGSTRSTTRAARCFRRCIARSCWLAPTSPRGEREIVLLMDPTSKLHTGSKPLHFQRKIHRVFVTLREFSRPQMLL